MRGFPLEKKEVTQILLTNKKKKKEEENLFVVVVYKGAGRKAGRQAHLVMLDSIRASTSSLKNVLRLNSCVCVCVVRG